MVEELILALILFLFFWQHGVATGFSENVLMNFTGATTPLLFAEFSQRPGVVQTGRPSVESKLVEVEDLYSRK